MLYEVITGGLQWIDLGYPCVYDRTAFSLCLNGNIIIGGLTPGNPSYTGLFLSADSCTTWTKIGFILPICGLSIPSGDLLAGTDSLGLFFFSDNGDSLGSRT